jgi:hypothetical protein
MESTKILSICILGVIIIGVGFLVIKRGDKKTNYSRDYSSGSRNKMQKPCQFTPGSPCLEQTPFKTGYLKNPPQGLGNLCASNKMIKNNVLYPIQPIYVDYRDFDGCSNPDMLVFNASP